MIVWMLKDFALRQMSDIDITMEVKRRKGRVEKMLKHPFWKDEADLFKHIKSRRK